MKIKLRDGLDYYSMATRTGIFRALAFAASVHIQLEPEVLWLAFGSLLELHHDVVTFAVR